MPAPGFILTLLVALSFTLATWLQPRAVTWNQSRASSGSLLNIVMGDARRMFADHFFVKADVYFHSGYYPSIFDQGRTNEVHISEQAGSDAPAGHEEHEHEYLKPPRDWVEAFGRNFFNTKHTELTGAGANEILPWLRIAAELDPQRVETYTVAAFWLRGEMKRPHDAEAFLREGQRANPDSVEILCELGRLYRENFQDNAHARTFFQLAARKLTAQEARTGEPDLPAKRQILVSLSRLDEAEGDIAAALQHLRQLHAALPAEREDERRALEKQIAELAQKSGAK
ncbi:MAG: hypothetical protein NTZ16_01710 [Verrucomicrobia bacterium]|nr:hypothetical protein [Verrucomicrobiota bacterium]